MHTVKQDLFTLYVPGNSEHGLKQTALRNDVRDMNHKTYFTTHTQTKKKFLLH